MVSLPTHQLIRALTPFFTVLLCNLSMGTTYPLRVYCSLLPLVFGVILATTGEYSSSKLGNALTLVGALLASIKTVATNRLQTAGLRFPALELIWRMNTLAFWQAMVVAGLNGELREVSRQIGGFTEDYFGAMQHVFLNAALAFGLNVSSYSTNRLVGALAMSVGGNVKQVVAVGLAAQIWGTQVGLAFVLGMFSLCSTRHIIAVNNSI